jgi:hypothetical protein
MLMQIRFGAQHGPICPTCKKSMYVTRRTPHPLYGNTYELQTFECRTCNFEIQRSADRSGLPHVNDAKSEILADALGYFTRPDVEQLVKEMESRIAQIVWPPSPPRTYDIS